MSNQGNRVLTRMGARDLSEQEVKTINAGIGTTTICTLPSATYPKGDGDPGECGH